MWRALGQRISRYRFRFRVKPGNDLATYQGLLQALVRLLEEAKAHEVAIEGNAITFTVEGACVPINPPPTLKGLIEVDSMVGEVRCCLRFSNYIIGLTVVMGLAAIVIAISGASLGGVLWATVSGWFFVVGIVYVFVAAEFRRFMKHGFREAGFSVVP